jgi:MSHA pilin protein MshC
MMGRSGFTVVELVVTIAIVGLLAAIAVPRLVAPGSFESRGFYDRAQMIVRQAQKTAIAWRRPVYVCFTTGSVAASLAAGCGTPLTHPSTGGPLSAAAPSGVTLSTATVSFDGLGRPSAGVTVTVTSSIADDPPRQIVIEAETGYVRA